MVRCPEFPSNFNAMVGNYAILWKEVIGKMDVGNLILVEMSSQQNAQRMLLSEQTCCLVKEKKKDLMAIT